jgi:hypothetical protein
MSQRPRTAPANPLEVWLGVVAGIFGVIGLGVYVFVPSQTRFFCSSLGSTLGSSLEYYLGQCPVNSAAQSTQPVLVAALFQLWGPLFLAVAVGALWDGWRHALLGRLLLWIGTLLLLAVTVPGLFVGGNRFFVPGMVFAVAASVAVGWTGIRSIPSVRS